MPKVGMMEFPYTKKGKAMAKKAAKKVVKKKVAKKMVKA
jgi:hypothetical protein